MPENRAALVLAADEVTSQLNAAKEWQPGQSWAAEFSAVKSWADWDEELEAMGTLHVDVVPVGYPEAEMGARGFITYLAEVDIGVRKRYESNSQEGETGRIRFDEVATLVLLVEQFVEWFCGERFNDTDAIVWQSADIRAAFVRDHLRRFRQYTGIVRLTFDVTKAIGAANV